MEYTKIQLRCDTLANWATYNPTLALGEFGYESDTKKAKIGDGLTPYNNLQYCFDVDKMTELYSALENVETIISDATGILQEVETATANAITATANANTATQNANTATSSANTATANANSKITEMEGVIDDANDLLDEMETALGAMETATTNAVNATTLANTATTNANQAIAGANNATYSANQAAQNANTAATNVSAKITDINNAISRANTATSSANTATANTEVAIREAYEARTETILATNEAISAITNAETATANAITATTNANTATANANTATTQANTAKNATIQATQNAITATTNANQATANANTATQNANTATANAQTATTNAINATNQAIEVTEAVDGRLTNLEDTKANKDGYYEEMGVGVADNLSGRGDGVSATFTYRTAGGDADIADGTATIQSIKGNSIVWNQRISDDRLFNSDFTTTQNWDRITKYIKIPANHKVLIHYNAITNETRTSISYYRQTDAGVKEANIKYYNPNSTFDDWFIFIPNGLTDRFCFINSAPGTTHFNGVNIFDLTLMFGEGNEPTIEEFKQMFPLEYYNYNAGEIINFSGSKIRTIGFNQWDEEWEKGVYSLSDGSKIANNDYIRSTNYIKVFPNTNYFVKWGNNADGKVIWYDVNKTFISHIDTSQNTEFLTPSNCHYITFYKHQTTYNNDININLSWSGYRNGEYEPYWEYERNLNIGNIMYDGEPLFPDGLCSAGSVRDEITPTKAIKRIGVVDLGSLNWSYASTIKLFHTQDYEIVGAKYAGGVSLAIGYESRTTIPNPPEDYPTNFAVLGPTNFGSWWSNKFVIKNSDYTNAASFKAAMQGQYLYYELETPIEVEFDEPLNLSYKVSDFGTEEILPSNTATPTTTAFVGTILYGLNAVDTLRRLPTEYLSINSLDSLINAFAPYFTITYNWDDNNNKYNFNVVPVETTLEPTNITE